MATRITLPIPKHRGRGSISFDLIESFEQVFDKCYPEEQIAAEDLAAHRRNSRFTLTSGKRLAVPPQNVIVIEEL